MRCLGALLTAGLLAGLGFAAAEGNSEAADSRHRVHARTSHHAAKKPPAPAPPAPPVENLVVHGQKRFSAAPVPNQEIHDPADALRDPSTGAPIGRFGGAYIDANPVPPINPGLKGDQSPVMVGVQR